MTKICTRCKEELSVERFSKKSSGKDGLQPICKNCVNEYHTKHYKKNRQKYSKSAKASRDRYWLWYQEIKSNLKCKTCGESHPACLHFHHKDSSSKSGNISDMVRRMLSKKTILDEIAKCEVLCANCHAKLHFPLVA